jgi:hypothetical protein
MEDIALKYPIHTVFILFLIISSNYIGELFPCRIQDVLMGNVIMKHFVAFLTLLFFVLIVEPSMNMKFKELIYNSSMMYLVFLVLINNSLSFFVASIIILGVLYIIHLNKVEIRTTLSNDTGNEEEKEGKEEGKEDGAVIKHSEKMLSMFEQMSNILTYLFAGVVSLGFIIYMGEKKIEYGKTFSYLTFIFGKPSCRNKSPEKNYIASLKAAFK